MGSGGSGQLLLGDKEDYYHFRKINFDELFSEEKENALDFQQNIKTLVLGGTIGLALTQKGEVYSWGEYFEKQILVFTNIISY